MRSDPSPGRRWLSLAALGLVFFAIGCEKPAEVRVYDAPKADTLFVAGPNANRETSSAQAGPVRRAPSPPLSGPRRILGAVVPLESGCYFLKATDSPERIQPLLSDFYDIVSEFSISASTGKPDMKLPEGWVMNPRNDIAMAEFVSPAATGSVKFTVTVLAMPAADQWQGYLLSNINRWRGQLKLPDITEGTPNDELISVNRPGSLLPGYIFDAIGNGSGGMSPPSMNSTSSPPPSSTSTSPAPAPSSPASEPATSQSSPPPRVETSEAKKPDLKYELPEGWTSAPGTPFRLATFAIASPEGDGEVTVSMALENPMGNTMMWYQQISREGDQEKIKAMAESTVSKAEKIAAKLGEGVLYTIRDSEQVDAPMLIVASLPSEREELHVFVKLRGPAQLVEAQRGNLMQFVQSLQLQ
ncbi:MAG: hypothetical protein ACK553_12845 [Planctomycetota bacterium]|jgi:hypothetical protein